jgi:hypothetical protein
MRSEQQVLESVNGTAAVNAVRRVAAEASARVYLTGGAIRDLFLGLTPADFDFVISVDPVQFAEKVAAVVAGQVSSRKLPTGNLGRYRGALGTLEFTESSDLSILDCLDRHYCFTVNSVAVDLERNQVLHFHTSLEDIRDRRIRAINPSGLAKFGPYIHLRAVRLAVSTPFFTFDQDTFLSLKNDIAVAAKARPEGVFRELSAILESPEYLRGIQLLHDLGFFGEIFKSLPFASPDVSPETIRLCTAIDDMAAQARLSISNAVPDAMLLLRTAALLGPAFRDTLRSVAPEQRQSWLIATGEQMESALCRLGMSATRAFRVRMMTIAYVTGIASVMERGARLEEAVEASVNGFGAGKGLLGAALICADWLASERKASASAEALKHATEVLTKCGSNVRRHREIT